MNERMDGVTDGKASSTQLVHGGDIMGYIQEYGTVPLDFSANISPLGLPLSVREAVVGALATADAYPDPLCRALRAAIAEFDGVAATQVVCGNGTADIIYRLGPALRPQSALVCVPTFAEYETALAAVGCVVQHHVLHASCGFAIDETFLTCIKPGIDLVFICQPNNPTGRTCSRDIVLAALERCEHVGAHLVVDECFVGFLHDPESISVQKLVSEHPALIVLKAFTKFYAMAGLRLGYALCSDDAVIQAVQSTGQPWAVSSLAQAAGIAALREDGYVDELRGLIRTERAFLKAGLRDRGIEAQGEANFLFFHVDGDFVAQMRRRGVLVRDCSNYPGLAKGWCRVAVRAHEENERLLQVITAVRGGMR